MTTLLKISLLIILVGITYLSLSPTETLVVGNDKVSHFIAYSVLMTNVGLLTYSIRIRFIGGVVFCILFGVLMEVIQHFIPGRVMSGWDMVANGLGVGIGVLILFLFYKKLTHVFIK